MLFKDIQLSIQKLFSMPDILFTKCNSDSIRHIRLAFNVDLDGVSYNNFIQEIGLRMVVVKDKSNKNVIIDQVLIGYDATLVVVVPYNIDYEEFSTKDRIKIIKDIYSVIIDIIRKTYPVVEESTFDKVLKCAPPILTVMTLSSYITDTSMKDYLDEYDILNEHQLYDCLSLNVEQLLDQSGVIAFLNQKQEEKHD